MSKNFVEGAVERLGLKSKFIRKKKKIYPQVKSLDKIKFVILFCKS